MIEWSVDGVDEVLVLTFNLKNFEKAIRPITTIWGTRMLLYRIAGWVNYPPQPATSKYHRTGTLGSTWKSVEQGSQMFAFYNPTTYAHWVVGDGEGKHQAGHMGHWWIAYNRVLEGIPGLEGEIVSETRAWYDDR